MSIEAIEVGKKCRGYTQLTTLSSAVSCPNPTGTTVIFQPEGNSIRWRADGKAPTASVGHLVTAGTTVKFTGELDKLQFIEVASSATLNVSVFE